MPDARRRLSFNPFSWGTHVEEVTSEVHKDGEDEGDNVTTTTAKVENYSLMTGSTSFSAIDDDNEEALININNKELGDSNVGGGGEEKEKYPNVIISQDDDHNPDLDLESSSKAEGTPGHDHLGPRNFTYPPTKRESEDNNSTTSSDNHTSRLSRWKFSRRHTSEPDNPPKITSPAERPRSVEFDLPPLDPVSLSGYSELTKTRLMTETLSEELRDLLPERLQLYTSWDLCYSLEQHGASLHTLYSNVIPKPDKRPGYMLIIEDKNGDIFGAYANEYFHTTESRRFYGNGECFLWKTSKLANGDIRFQAFPYTGVNDFVIFCAPNFLSMGGGDGHYGLWLDDSLEHGVSSRSITFGNEILSSETNFYVVALEVWRIGPS